MTRTVTDSRVWGWVAHLRDGGSTPWSAWSAPAEPAGADLPGAQQLELLRRLNLRGRVTRELADRVLLADPPRRTRSGLPLLGESQPAYGPRPVDPETLRPQELVRLAAVLLAQDLAAAPIPAERRALTRPWRIRYHLAGDPELTGALRQHLERHGRPPGGYGGRTVVVGTDTGQMLVDLWTAQSLRDGGAPWGRWWRAIEQRRGLPRSVDLFALAEAAARQPAPGSVHVVTEPERALRLLGMRRTSPAPASLAAHAVDLGRLVSAALRPLAVTSERRRRVTRVLRPTLAAVEGSSLVLPAAHRPWVDAEAERLRGQVAGGRYPVHGQPDALLPTDRPGVEAPDGAATFELATRLLLSGALAGGPDKEVR